MYTTLNCIPCLIKHAISSVKMVTENAALQEKVVRLVLQELLQLDFQHSAPYMNRLTHRIIKQHCACPDPYKEIKQKFNQGILNLYNHLEKSVKESAYPFEQALRYAASANIIDFGLSDSPTMEQAQKTLESCLSTPIRFNTAHDLAEDIQKAQKILYLGDNCGEIVVDKLLLSRMPCEKVTFVVKGQPIINDALMEDAISAGIPDLVKVIDNGSDVPGTILELCSERFQREFAEADLIIAKGQGNYETLADLKGKKIYFIFKAKCDVITEHLGCSLGDIILKKHQ